MTAQNSSETPDVEVAQLDSVGVRIGENQILEDIDLLVPRGSVVAVIGASGSGKSTLLRLLNGLQQATSGRVLRDGRLLTSADSREIRFNTGYALQQIGLLPHLSVRQNIELPLQLAQWPRARRHERCDVLAARMQVSQAQLQRYPHELSGGQQQRAGLARAMALKPDLLLLDEAFSGLDAITRVELHDTFNALRGAEIDSCLLVTHDLAEANRLADRLVILRHGRIVRQGLREDVLNDPRDDYAARLIETFIG
ncbi:MAG: ATP-binding cassette domain-containing protein [Pseudomonadota bacterium]